MQFLNDKVRAGKVSEVKAGCPKLGHTSLAKMYLGSGGYSTDTRKVIGIVVVVYQCTIISVMVSLEKLILFCSARLTLCWNVRDTLAASWNLSNYYLTLG